MPTSRVDYNGETLIDISEDTVTPETLAEGATAHNSNGEQITGTMKSGGIGEQKQADWLQNDSTKPDFIKNKPFGEGVTDIVWNGNTEGLICVPITLFGMQGYFYKVGNEPFTQEQLENATLTFSGAFGGTSEPITESVNLHNDIDNDSLCINGLLALSVAKANDELSYVDVGLDTPVTFPEAGIWFLWTGEEVFGEVAYTMALSSVYGIKKIDPKFLPEMNDSATAEKVAALEEQNKAIIENIEEINEVAEEFSESISGKVDKTALGAVNGVATLDANGKIPINQLPEGINTGSSNNAKFEVKNNTGWLSKTVAYGAECSVFLEWSSIEDEIATGNGTVKISVGDTVKAIYEVEQGEREINIDNYLLIGKNTISIEISDLYGNNRKIVFTVNCVKVSISSYFDASVAQSGNIKYTYTPTGAIEKTVHFIVDGEEIGSQTVTLSGREQEFTIPAQSHGHHTLKVYFTGEIDGQPVESNELYYDLICTEEGNTTPIIATAFKTDTVKQFATLSIPYIVYDPALFNSSITLRENGEDITTLTVDRTLQTWSYKAENVGATKLEIVCGDVIREITFTVAENKIDVHAETSSLELHLTSKGRSNNEETPLDWSYNGIAAELTGFNLTNDGWQLDNNGDTVLRVTGDARVNIPFKIFENDFRTNGKTIEFEFATRDVLNYDAVIISSWSGNRGINITAQKALLAFEGGEIFTQYKEDEHIRIAFTVEKKAENKLVRIYINGIMSGVIQYSEDTDFSQASPVGISIGSNECTTDIYCIRVYDNNLSQYQILDNWIADTQDIEELINRYDRNNIFDDYGNVAVEKLPTTLPYLVLEAENYEYLPQFKGDKERPVNGRYVDPMWAKRCFTFNQAQIDVQGTSSQYYSRKNYKIKFKNGFIIDGVTKATYQLRETSMPTNTFTFKADVASSEGANNVELCKLYDDICPVKTPPQKEDSRVRQGIEGYPILVFYYDGSSYFFLGKYNFNNDKGTPEVFGFAEGDESWEILQNNTDMVVWKNDDFSTDDWKKSFEARYPEDNTDTANLQAFASWLKSTDTEAVDTDEEKAERLAKFKNELAHYANVDMLIFNYIFTELFLMVDNRAKNAFPTRYDKDGKWLILPYDYDTAIGINNEGELKYGYQFEDIDYSKGNELVLAENVTPEMLTNKEVVFVFNGQDSVLYMNLRLAFANEIAEMYKSLRSKGVLSYDEVEKRFSEHQSCWGEAIFNEDARFKYIAPLTDEGNSTYLPMLQGSKAEQRKWWLYNRFRYIDSKYNAGDSLSDFIMLRGYGVSDIYIKPYADIYATVAFDSVPVSVRALRSMTPEEGFKIETPLTAGNGAVISIYSASQLASIGDLSGLKVGMADFSKGTKLSKLKIGDGAEGYENPNLNNLTIGNLTLLTELDVRNCTALAQGVDVSGCINLEHAYFEGTKITGVTLPNGGILKTLHLPSTVSSLVIRNQPLLTDFEMPSYENLTTLRLENIDVDLFDTLSMILQMPENSRVRVLGVEWTIDTAEEIFEAFDKLDSYRGLDEYGNNVDKPQISGIIRTGIITGDQLEEMRSRYPNFTIDYEHIICRVEFYNYDGELLHTAYVEDEGNCYDPIAEGLIDTPTKPETDESKFIYSGWDKSLEKVSANRNITALYDEYKKYYISFIDNFGNAVQVNGNDTNVYYDIEGENAIALPANLPNYSIVDGEGATWDYHFEGWSLDGENVIDVPAVVSGTDYHITYQAVFSEHRVNVVKFMNDSVVHSELHLYEGGNIIVPETPARVSTYQFDYEFAGWTIDGETIVDVAETIGNEDITYIAKYTAIDRYYTIKFLDWNGAVLQSSSVKHDEIPAYNRENPTREETAQYFYDFDGWTPAITKVTGDAVYTATYLQTLRTYSVTWKNEDGSILEGDVNVPYGTMPSYDGATPTKQGNAQYTYIFAGWHIEISEVKGDMIYIATYTAEVNKYKVTWKNEDGTVLETDTKVPYGDMPEYNGSTPTKTATAQYDFAFAGWDTAVSEVTGDVVYTAIYTQHIRSYTIKFVNADGAVLYTNEFEYGSVPTYSGSTPTKPSTAQYEYAFSGWGNVVAVTGEATYTAQYTSSVRSYTVTWKNDNGTVLKTDTVKYGSTPSYSGSTPTKSATAQYTYTHSGWTPSVVAVTGNVTYTATYTSTVRSYTITWKVGSQTTTQTYAYGSTPTAPYAVGENFTADGLTLTVQSWSPAISSVAGDITYTANLSASITSRFSKVGAVKSFYDSDEFLNGTGYIYSGGTIFVYGFDFSKLSSYSNVSITGFAITMNLTCNSQYSSTTVECCLATGFPTSGSSVTSYTDLGDGNKTVIDGTKLSSKENYADYSMTEASFPNALAWMNANIDKVISGKDSNTFGVKLYGNNMRAKSVTMTLNLSLQF